MPMTHLQKPIKRTLNETKLEPMVDYPQERYPWGTRIDLNDETMEMMGIDADNFAVEDSIKLTAKAKVISTNKREDIDSDTGSPKVNQSVELQITHLELSAADSKTVRELMRMLR